MRPAEAVGAGDDHAILHAQLLEGEAAGAQLLDEVLARHGHLAVLMAALLGVRHLVLDLEAAGAGLDQLLGEQIGGVLIAEAGIDIGDDRNHMGLEIVDGLDRLRLGGGITLLAGGLQVLEQVIDGDLVGLAQGDVDLLDQVRDSGLLMHGLVRQMAEAVAQTGHHPAGEIDIGALRGAAQALDGLDHLLGVEAGPAAEGLGELRAVGIIGGHVGAHHARHVAGDVEMGVKAVLQLELDDVIHIHATGRDALRKPLCQFCPQFTVALTLAHLVLLFARALASCLPVHVGRSFGKGLAIGV